MSKIIKASGGIAYETDSGYESQEDWPPQAGNLALIKILDEIARILTINGDETLARITLEEAIARTQQALVV
jgi:hypothetical protein